MGNKKGSNDKFLKVCAGHYLSTSAYLKPAKLVYNLLDWLNLCNLILLKTPQRNGSKIGGQRVLLLFFLISG